MYLKQEKLSLWSQLRWEILSTVAYVEPAKKVLHNVDKTSAEIWRLFVHNEYCNSKSYSSIDRIIGTCLLYTSDAADE